MKTKDSNAFKAERLRAWYVKHVNTLRGDLADYAAESAMDKLVENWAAAIRDGYEIENLIPDVNDTIKRLLDFLEVAYKELPDVVRGGEDEN